MADLVGLGEILGTFSSRTPGPLGNGSMMTLGIAGAEANALIAAARLGRSTAWLGRLSTDSIGRFTAARLRAEGVDTSGVKWDSGCASSLLMKHARTADSIEVDYFRSNGPGSRLVPEDLENTAIENARILHLTGITPALSIGARRTVEAAASLARSSDVMVSFDLNYRSRLWDKSDARRDLRALVASVDILFGSPDELEIFGVPPRGLLSDSLREIVVKNGSNGATVFTHDGELSVPALGATVVDPVGAGDAFVGAYLAAILEGRGVADRLTQAIAVGAFAVSTLGDWEGLPTSRELELYRRSEDVRR